MAAYRVEYKGIVVTDQELRNRQTPEALDIINLAHDLKNKEGEIGPMCFCKCAQGNELNARKDNKGQKAVARRHGDQLGHMPNCAFGQPPHPTSECSIDAIKERGGGLEAYLTVDLTFGDRQAPKSTHPEPTYSGLVTGPSQARTTPEALLNRLLVETGATQWGPGLQRSNSIVFGGMKELGKISLLNDKPMLNDLYIAVEEDSADLWEAKVSKLTGSLPEVRNGTIVLGEVRAFRRSQGLVKFTIKGIDSDFKLSADQFELMRRSFPRVWSQFRRLSGFYNRCRIVFLGVVSVDCHGNAKVESICFRLMSMQYIPCDSYCEVKIAHKLVLERREFIRVIYARDDGTKYRADFELLDMDRRYVMEVFGFNSPKYILEMESKITYWINNVLCGLWYWKAFRHPTIIPRFPRRISVPQGA